LRTQGELIDALIAFGFERLGIFQPSMILTPTNRYGASQGLSLAMWPKLEPVLRGAWRKYRGVPVATLGAAMAANLSTRGVVVEWLHWDDFLALASLE
jgi:L-fucose isomerase-like protein